ncbi:MAG: tail fiber domain-containing protein [Saprospiraceae bacterium]
MIFRIILLALISIFILPTTNAQLVYSLDVTAPTNQPNVANFVTTGTTTNGGTAVRGDATSFATNNGIGGYFAGGDKGISAVTKVQDLSITGSVYGVHTVNSTSGKGSRYGVYSFMNIDASSDGKHYGFYTSVNPTEGEDYGIYAVCGGEDDWAGYFLGAGYFEAKPWMAEGNGPAKKQPLEINAEINAADPASTSVNKGLLIYYKGNNDWGGSLVALENVDGGFNVGRGQGTAFAPIYASAFNIGSDKRVKKDIHYLNKKDVSSYMESIRDIETATFRYLHQSKKSRTTPHLGVIAQSLPAELLTESTATTDGAGEKTLAVNLADWAGLLTVGVKENDRRVAELTIENEALQTKVTQLEQEMAAIRQMLATLDKTALSNPSTTQTATLANDYLQQNAPNPFHQNTAIRYQLPENTQVAQLNIFDVQGTLVKSVTLNSNRDGLVELEKGTLAAGNYQYSLIADGKVLATKQMVLTK